jgi:hypothetical protein
MQGMGFYTILAYNKYISFENCMIKRNLGAQEGKSKPCILVLS